MSTCVAALYAAAGGPPASGTPAQQLVDDWASGGAGSDGFAMVFEDAAGTDAPSIYVKDSGTPANDTDINLTDDFDAFNSFLTYTSPSAKIVRQSDGDLKYCAQNRLTYSEQLDNAAWTKDGLSVTANAGTDPDGGSTADLLTENSATSNHRIYSGTVGVVGQYNQFSAYVKNNSGTRYVGLRIRVAGGYAHSVFDLATDTKDDSSDIYSSSITDVGDGWHLIKATAFVESNADVALLYFSNTATAPAGGATGVSYAGDGSSSMYVWGLAYRIAPADETYLPTTTAARYALPIQYDSSNNAEGLLGEPASTNLLTYSSTLASGWSISDAGSFTLTANDATGPDGESSLTKVEITDATNERHRVFLSYTGTASTATTTSFIIKPGTLRYVGIRSYLTVSSNYAWVNVTYDLTALSVTDVQTGASGATQTHNASGIQDLGDGFYRIWVTTTPNNTDMNVMLQAHSSGTPTLDSITAAESFAGTAGQYFHFFHAQVELGSVPTSPIITTGATATRAKDNLQKPTSSAPYGTSHAIYVKIKSNNADDGSAHIVDVSDSAFTDRITLAQSSGPSTKCEVEDANVTTVNTTFTGSSISTGTAFKYAIAVATDDFAHSLNGATVETDSTTGSPSDAGDWHFGQRRDESSSTIMNSLIQEFLYLPERMSNTDLVSITT